ncbi:hypothetical protein [Streptomyces nojiriensis]|uniref:hypothetical protein n=1 Tax=Streptomyces nojiriensis TaxID=66374 RepID=UPI0035E0AFCC
MCPVGRDGGVVDGCRPDRFNQHGRACVLQEGAGCSAVERRVDVPVEGRRW